MWAHGLIIELGQEIIFLWLGIVLEGDNIVGPEANVVQTWKQKWVND